MKHDLFISKSFNETQEIAFNFAKDLKAANVICLYGNLGSGKTTFVQGFARGLGIKKRIISPTFIIARSYKIETLNFIHIDLYRIENKKDLLGLGINEMLTDKNNTLIIEWAEKLGDLMPKKRTDLNFSYIDENTRKIKINKYD